MKQLQDLQAQQQQQQIKEDRKVQAENMRLKKRIYELEEEVQRLKYFIGV